jgi:hypothetical protein
MKRVTAILAIFLFLFTNSGLALSVHYCGGEAVSFDIFSTDNRQCDCGATDMPKGCCENETTFVNASSDFVNSGSFFLNSINSVIDLAYISFSTDLKKISWTVSSCVVLESPPLKFNTPINIMNRVFLI